MDKIDELLTRGVENIIPNKDELEKILRSGKKLNVYFGIDPTATHIHLGHAVPLRKLQSLVELGHNVTFLIGDFTALIGDTSDKESERPILTKEEIEINFQTYKAQAQKILDFSKVTLRHNSKWLDKLTPRDFVGLFQKFSLNDFISRELIKKRLATAGHIRLDEVVYPLLQGYDSYLMDTDLQIGGTDQTFNMQAGRFLQKSLRNKESFVVATGFLTGTDGRKMSKSWDNAIWLDDSPSDIFGKVMSIRDDLINEYFVLGTNIPLDQIKTDGHPMSLKKELAWQIVLELHSAKDADKAKGQFENTFQKGNIDSADAVEVAVGGTIIESLIKSGLASSKSEAKRLLEQKAIEKDGKILSTDDKIKPGVYKIGKKKFLKIV